MTRIVRAVLVAVGSLQALLALAYFMQLPFAVALWPFAGTTPLTFIFISSILAAAAASTLWVAASKDYAALAGIALDYIGIMAPLAVVSYVAGAIAGNPQMLLLGFGSVVGALFGAGLLLWSLPFPLDRTLRTPSLVRLSFVIFIVALLIVSVRLIVGTPNVIPWTITPELSVVIGWMFLGAALYFVYGLLRPFWANAAGQLLGFLAYDLVLIVPFASRLPAAAPEHRMGLIIYTAVVVYSGLLAIYYLFTHKPTRVWSGTLAKVPAIGAEPRDVSL
jgi:hypothetical protein